MQRCNFHTHTKYSDGTDTPQEMIEAAIGFGFKALGFSEDGGKIIYIEPKSNPDADSTE